MPITIHLSGDEESAHVGKCVMALNAYHGVVSVDQPGAASDGSADPATTTSGKGRGRGKSAAASTPAADSGTASESSSTPAADPGPPEVSVEQIRAVAAQFNTDDTRPAAIEILKSFGLASVSKSADLPADKRAALLDALQKKHDELAAMA